MKIGVVLPTSAEWPELRDVARQAEEVGVASLWAPDGFVDGHPDAPTLLSALAAVTQGVELGVYMLNPSLRDSALLSKVVGTLDRLAPGRIRVLLGTGWDRADYAALGREFASPAERAEATKEAVSVLKVRTGASVEVAGVRDDVLRLAAAEADGWSVSADALDAFFERIAFLRRACDEAGRTLGDLRISCTLPLGGALSRAADLAEHGMDELFVGLPEGSECRDQLHQLMRELSPQGQLTRGGAQMAEGMIGVQGIEIWTEGFGDPADPTVLLINGPASGIFFPDELCELLVDGGRHVIRYDHRDIGRSSTVSFEENPYTISDLAADAVGVLDAYGVSRAHLVGFSMGGMIAQTVALEHPDRVASLTSWGSTPLGASYFEGTGAGLPAPDPEILGTVVAAFQPATDEDEYVERMLAVRRAFAGSLEPVDEEGDRVLMKRSLARTRDRQAALHLQLAGLASPDRTEALAALTTPTLVVHGTADPIMPLAHGEATAEAIPGARLMAIDDLGHDFPRVALPGIVAAILEHTSRVPDAVQG